MCTDVHIFIAQCTCSLFFQVMELPFLLFSVAVLLFNVTRSAFVLVKQFRPGKFGSGSHTHTLCVNMFTLDCISLVGCCSIHCV